MSKYPLVGQICIFKAFTWIEVQLLVEVNVFIGAALLETITALIASYILRHQIQHVPGISTFSFLFMVEKLFNQVVVYTDRVPYFY